MSISSSGRERRLNVSALAAMVNPSSQRVDVWHLLDDATQQLAAVHRAGYDTSVEASKVLRLLNRLAAYERFWLFPGARWLKRLQGHLEAMDTIALAAQANLVARLLAEYGDRAALFDTSESLAEQELVGPGDAAAVLHGAARATTRS